MRRPHRQIVIIVLVTTAALVGLWLVRTQFPAAGIMLAGLPHWAEPAAVTVAYLTSSIAVICFALLATLLAVELHHTQAWLHMVISLTATVLVCWLLKEITQLPRPTGNTLVASGLSDFAFPSTHASTAGALTILAFFHTQRWTQLSAWLLSVVGVTGVLLIGLSRIILHAHTLVDITAGVVLGVGIGLITISIWPTYRQVFTQLLGHRQPISE